MLICEKMKEVEQDVDLQKDKKDQGQVITAMTAMTTKNMKIILMKMK